MSTQSKLTRSQIEWARQHDWFIWGGMGEVTAIDEVYRTENGKMVLDSITYPTFNNFQALREFAGY